ncbi:uncharacterized protein SEPMUDRAFT_120995 [Sphaerulina musiva SO2202]|uniref:Uncharacterized protein n=1 Tax=Sphaerulina musiva (strain SO2202) TaxID=692275 RepID=M3AUE3_SPHMS|nr:uncharacterized protein SEPMUDRAFT_120995 [Sphaerulina musiva SO2202]EMF09114.1 hypothetical protein SEPMUDRAFT_120995 [Sphaerulina musiva SO2202]
MPTPDAVISRLLALACGTNLTMPKRKSNALEALANKRAKLGAASKLLEEYSLKPNTLRDRERTAAIDEEKRA